MTDPTNAPFSSRVCLALWIFGAAGCSAAPQPSPAANSGGGALGRDAATGGGAATSAPDTGGQAPAQRPTPQVTDDAAASVEPGSADVGAPPTSSGGGGRDDASAADGAGSGSAACTSLFCEDFEKGQFDTTVWTLATPGGTAVVQQTKAAHGKFAAQFHGTAAGGYAFIIAKNAPAALRTHHFGRAYVSIGPTIPTGHTGLLYAGSAGSPHDKYMEIAALRGGWQLNYVSLVGAGGEAPYRVGCTDNVNGCQPGILRPTEPWICIQWEFNDMPDSIAFSVDGKAIATYSPITFNNQTTNLVTGFVEFGFGFYNWHPDGNAFDVYYDDIALDTKPVACL